MLRPVAGCPRNVWRMRGARGGAGPGERGEPVPTDRITQAPRPLAGKVRRARESRPPSTGSTQAPHPAPAGTGTGTEEGL